MAITLVTTVNDDSIVNISGQDIIADAQAGNDTIVTAGGKDTIEGGAGNDFISTGANHDTITDSSGDDSLNAGSGNDSITDSDGSDSIDGGSGNDVITDTASIPPEGGEGELDVNNINAGSGHDVVSIAGAFRNLVNLGSGDDVLTIEGEGGGIIEVLSFVQQDVFFNNVVLAESGHDTVTTDDGNDSVNAGSGNDTVTTGGGFDAVIGLDGNDTVINNDNVIVIEGGEGNADIILPTGDHFEGGTGFDTLSYAFSEEGVNVDLDTGGGTQTAFGGDAEGDFISGFEHVIGGAGNDVLTGNALDNSLIGNNGNDTLSGEGGKDFLQGGDGTDLLLGGAGNDTIDVSLVDEDDDTVVGGAGNDTINMSGSLDSDLVDINPGDGVDTINGFDNAASPQDRLDISDLLVGFAGADLNDAVNPANQFVNLLNSGADLHVQVDANGGVGGPFTTVAILTGFAGVTAADLNDNIIVT